ncbi:formin-like protein 20 isoform X2 [Humulus lupulus]|nr:formin-like protein 20 isoform X2 [Humulus lupulus]XP_062101739.1 formin-like protein 20 isoform X2 [Humulus lupulus]
MLTKVKMPLPDMMAAVLAMEESVLDVDQVENLIKFFPTKEEMQLLKGYTGEKESLGKCEQYFMELMKVPRVESKLQVFSFKIQFNCQISEFKKSLNTVNSACEEAIHALKDEIREINQRLIDTVIDISKESSVVAAATEGGEGTIVKWIELGSGFIFLKFCVVISSHFYCLFRIVFLLYFHVKCTWILRTYAALEPLQLQGLSGSINNIYMKIAYQRRLC